MPYLVPASDQAIARAARRLREGGVVAFPTETVYGLGADTFNERALEEVYELKGRPPHNPLIAHVEGAPGARRVVAAWDERCERLARRFWPGPLTLVVPRAARVPSRATAGLATIAVRAPAHPVAQALLAAFGGPISAPSANRSGCVSPTTAQHVAEDFSEAADLLIIDGGPCPVGIESTVLDLSGPVPRVLRPGAVTVEQLREALGADVAAVPVTEQAASPGTSPWHYAPRTPALLCATREIPRRLEALREPAAVLAWSGLPVAPPHRPIAMPRDPRGYAARLYGALREADSSGASVILIEEPPPEEGLWAAVRDRLARATQR